MRSQAAEDAGLSEHQRKIALRLAAVPASEFEAAVESERPPTVTALAERGRQVRSSKMSQKRLLLEIWLSFDKQVNIKEIAIERDVAILMAAWSQSCPEARRRFFTRLDASS